MTDNPTTAAGRACCSTASDELTVQPMTMTTQTILAIEAEAR